MSHLMIAFDGADLDQLSGFGVAYGGSYDVLLLSGDLKSVGASRAFAAALPSIPPADGLASSLVEFVRAYETISFVSSMRAKDLAGRMAGLLSAAMVTDLIGVVSPDTFQRPVVAGSMIATVQVKSTPRILIFRASAFPATEAAANGTQESVTLEVQGVTTVKQAAQKRGGRPDLSQAKVIVTGGRPLKDSDTFERVIGATADALGGAVGATRAAVDSGLAANDLQVGQTGKIVAPDLYVAAGVSGSTQHMAGIKDSKVIVAINTDPDAPIFESADLGLVADLYEALPALSEKLKKS